MAEMTDLRAFIQAKVAAARQNPDEPVIDWNARKQKWLDDISGLYELIRSWLQQLEKDGAVSYLMSNVNLTEEPLGTYPVPVLSILIGKQRVAFYPKGTLLVGAEGRVDIRGHRGIKTIIFNDGQWHVVTGQSRLGFVPFNQSSFQDILNEVME